MTRIQAGIAQLVARGTRFEAERMGQRATKASNGVEVSVLEQQQLCCSVHPSQGGRNASQRMFSSETCV